jgi:hypothetical protein
MALAAAKVVVHAFRNGGKVHTKEIWVYMEENIQILDQFVYLGVLLNFNDKCLVTEYLYNVCENTKRNSHNWATFIKEQLGCLGLSYMWHNQSNLNTNVCMPIIKQRLRDLFIQNLYSNMEHPFTNIWLIIFVFNITLKNLYI